MNIYKTYPDYICDFAFECQINDEQLNKHRKINKRVNVVVAAIIAVLCQIKNMGTTAMINIMVLAYIAFDIICIGINAFIKKVYTHRIKQRNKAYAESLSNHDCKTLDDMLQQCTASINVIKDKENKRIMEDTSAGTSSKIDYDTVSELSRLNSEANILREYLEKYKKTVETQESIENSVHADEVQAIRNRVNEMKELGLEDEPFKDEYQSLCDCAENIVEKVKNRPSAVNRVNRAFNVYIPELIQLIYMCRNSDSSNDKKVFYQNTVIDIISTATEYLKDIETGLNKKDEFEFVVSANVLKEELEKEIRKENANNV